MNLHGSVFRNNIFSNVRSQHNSLSGKQSSLQKGFSTSTHTHSLASRSVKIKNNPAIKTLGSGKLKKDFAPPIDENRIKNAKNAKRIASITPNTTSTTNKSVSTTNSNSNSTSTTQSNDRRLVGTSSTNSKPPSSQSSSHSTHTSTTEPAKSTVNNTIKMLFISPQFVDGVCSSATNSCRSIEPNAKDTLLGVNKNTKSVSQFYTDYVSERGGGDALANTWNRRVFRPKTGNDKRTFSLSTGKYHVKASAAAHMVGSHKLRLLNIFTQQVLLEGISYFCEQNGVPALLEGVITIDFTSEVCLDHYTEKERKEDGLGKLDENQKFSVFATIMFIPL